MLPAMVNVVGEQRTRGQAQVTMPVVVAGRAGGPLGPWAPGFAEWLGSRGYAPETVAGYLRWLGWLSGWLVPCQATFARSTIRRRRGLPVWRLRQAM